MMAGHGPDAASWQAASEAELKPQKIADTMAFMVETCWPYRPTQFALDHAQPSTAGSRKPGAVIRRKAQFNPPVTTITTNITNT